MGSGGKRAVEPRQGFRATRHKGGVTPPLHSNRRGGVKEEELAAKLKEAAKDGKIPCALAFKLARENGRSTQELGTLLNRLKIKISECQLGCF